MDGEVTYKIDGKEVDAYEYEKTKLRLKQLRAKYPVVAPPPNKGG